MLPAETAAKLTLVQEVTAAREAARGPAAVEVTALRTGPITCSACACICRSTTCEDAAASHDLTPTAGCDSEEQLRSNAPRKLQLHHVSVMSVHLIHM